MTVALTIAALAIAAIAGALAAEAMIRRDYRRHGHPNEPFLVRKTRIDE